MAKFQDRVKEAQPFNKKPEWNRLYLEYLLNNITQEDLEQILENENDAEFWENFRLRYAESGFSSDTMLEELSSEIIREIQERKRRNAEREQPAERQSAPTAERPKLPPTRSLPEPKISSSRRRGNNPAGGGGSKLRSTGRKRRPKS